MVVNLRIQSIICEHGLLMDTPGERIYGAFRTEEKRYSNGTDAGEGGLSARYGCNSNGAGCYIHTTPVLFSAYAYGVYYYYMSHTPYSILGTSEDRLLKPEDAD